MSDDVEYLKNYKPDTLYLNPTQQGAYANVVVEGETLIGEVDITARVKVAVSAFFVNERREINSVKITRLLFREKTGWIEDGSVKFNNTDAEKLRNLIKLLNSIDLTNAMKNKISLQSFSLENLENLLQTENGFRALQGLAESPLLSEDIIALQHKREEIVEFEKLLYDYHEFGEIYIKKYGVTKLGEENVWQHFFERNPWIFGYGLNYHFLRASGENLETMVSGYSDVQAGTRIDALMETQALMSQHVLIEIKKPSTELLRRAPYRSGTWSISPEITDAISQIQKAAFDFKRSREIIHNKTGVDGSLTGEFVYTVEPRSYLVVGRLSQLENNPAKFTCFELFRAGLSKPEIITYDELYERAKAILSTISKDEADRTFTT